MAPVEELQRLCDFSQLYHLATFLDQWRESDYR